MKTTKLFLASAIMFAVLSFNATGATEPVKANALEKVKACAVTAEDVKAYLQNGPHHHGVNWVVPIPGTANWSAGIENCGTATVYTSNGIITGHSDQSGICGG